MNFVAIPASIEVRHNSPGFAAIYHQIHFSRRNRILDLGSFCASNFRFLSTLGCKLHFENLDEFLRENQTDLYSDQIYGRLEEYLSGFAGEELFNVILTWDIFNYLDLDSIERLIERLRPFCARNALIHVIRHLGTNVPAIPCRFRIATDGELVVSRSTQTNPAAVRYRCTSATLLKRMPQFRLEQTFMNHTGMQPWMTELVLKYVPQKAESAGAATSEQPRPAPTTTTRPITPTPRILHTSYALEAILTRLKQYKFPKVLDLGLKNKTVYDRFLPVSSGVYSRDVYTQLQQSKDLTAILNFNHSIKFDVILLWDTANFYSPEQIKQMFAILSGHMHADTLVYAMVYTGRELPIQPQRLQMLGDKALAVFPSAKARVDRPLTSSCLLKAMGFCQLKDTYIFQPGMQVGISEYLFAARL